MEHDDFTAEFVLTETLAEGLTAHDSAVIASLVDCGVKLWETDETVPFGLYIARRGDTSQIAIEFRDGDLVTGLLANDTAESVAWAKQTFEQFRERAMRLE
jgi:hypothetical protein